MTQADFMQVLDGTPVMAPMTTVTDPNIRKLPNLVPSLQSLAMALRMMDEMRFQQQRQIVFGMADMDPEIAFGAAMTAKENGEAEKVRRMLSCDPAMYAAMESAHVVPKAVVDFVELLKNGGPAHV